MTAGVAALADIRQRQQLPHQSRPESIKTRRQEIRQELEATRDPNRIAELSSEWMELSRQIIKAKCKEAK